MLGCVRLFGGFAFLGLILCVAGGLSVAVVDFLVGVRGFLPVGVILPAWLIPAGLEAGWSSLSTPKIYRVDPRVGGVGASSSCLRGRPEKGNGWRCGETGSGWSGFCFVLDALPAVRCSLGRAICVGVLVYEFDPGGDYGGALNEVPAEGRDS